MTSINWMTRPWVSIYEIARAANTTIEKLKKLIRRSEFPPGTHISRYVIRWDRDTVIRHFGLDGRPPEPAIEPIPKRKKKKKAPPKRKKRTCQGVILELPGAYGHVDRNPFLGVLD